MEEKASQELKDKVTLVAMFFDSLCTAFGLGASTKNIAVAQAFALHLASAGIRVHANRVFGDLDPDTITVGECYDLLFTVNDESIAFVEAMETSLDLARVAIRGEDGRTPSEALRDILSA